jgi:hypothetical protein
MSDVNLKLESVHKNWEGTMHDAFDNGRPATSRPDSSFCLKVISDIEDAPKLLF